MKKVRGFEVKHIENEIVCSKAFLRKASQYGTDEYKAFIGIKRDFPSYAVRIVEPKKAVAKMSMKGLTREFMELYISKNVDVNSQAYIDFEGMKKLCEDNENAYMVMRGWFVKTFPNWDGKEEARKNAKAKKDAEKRNRAELRYAEILVAQNEEVGSEETDNSEEKAS